MKCCESLEEHFFGTATVGDRGQVVIPADARKKCDINPGDKVLVMSHPTGNGLMIFKINAMREVLAAFQAEIERIESSVLRQAQDAQEAQDARQAQDAQEVMM